MRYFLDTEFDGKGGPLISLALIREDGASLYCVTEHEPQDPWVRENVAPVVLSAPATAILCPFNSLGALIADFIRSDPGPEIVADWPDDIQYLCRELTAKSLYWTDPEGELQGISPLRFWVGNVDAYPTTLPGAVQHNAWWDAMALRHFVQSREAEAHGQTT